MTKEREILHKQYLLLIDRLDEVDPTTNPQLYKTLLDMIEKVAWLPEFRIGDPVLSEDFPKPEPSVEEFAPPVITPLPDPIPEIDEPTEETKTYSKEEVRAELAMARKRGVNVAELLQEFGVDQFPAVPASRYGELMDKLAEL